MARMLEARLKEKGYMTKLEHRIPVAQEIRIPDICAWSRSEFIGCDVAVMKDTLGLDRIHEFKYDTPDINK